MIRFARLWRKCCLLKLLFGCCSAAAATLTCHNPPAAPYALITYHQPTMRSFTVTLLLVAIAACSAFAPVSRTAAPVPKISLSMADTEVEEIKTPKTLPDPSDRPKNIVKNIPKGEIREVKWVDDAPTANVDFAMSWGYLFVVLPGVLFLNDIFHVVPKGTWGIF